ncbi:UPF0125 protein yfjF [hydrothermal vent metagenome]|uniref:UPF0125 protein yfjF n=1 Tax=hydrothermal vent metagenome TaxID=652676 RepID=A0A1W1C6G1_9ZZZZ
MQIEVVYALEKEQTLLSLDIQEPYTVQNAIEKSKIMDKYPEIDLTKNKVGIFGKLAKLDSILREKDRVEIYRPLIADPKQIRKQRAAEGKQMRSKK